MIRPQKVGHVVLKVRNLARAEDFYTRVLGFEAVARLKRPAGVFFTLGDQHHDLALLEVSPEADPPKEDQVGLHHVALKVENLEALKAAWRALKSQGVPIVRAVDHGITLSVYFLDPEGNRLELYCDVGEEGLERLKRQREMALEDFPPLDLDS